MYLKFSVIKYSTKKIRMFSFFWFFFFFFFCASVSYTRNPGKPQKNCQKHYVSKFFLVFLNISQYFNIFLYITYENCIKRSESWPLTGLKKYKEANIRKYQEILGNTKKNEKKIRFLEFLVVFLWFSLNFLVVVSQSMVVVSVQWSWCQFGGNPTFKF